jgi:pimeloyl-ACP methyl ester carboxylesterase
VSARAGQVSRFLVVGMAWLLAACAVTPGSQGPPATASDDAAASPTAAPSVLAPSPTIVSTHTSPRLLAGEPMASCTAGGSRSAWCGTLRVPEDRSDPSGRIIGLRVVVVPALAPIAQADPLFALAGGPGGASTESFDWLPDTFAAVHATRDIVLVDQRGTGGSNALTLAAPPDTTGLSAAEADARLSAWARDGLAALDADPRFYTSAIAADDLDAVRAALGYTTINLYGPSYGGTLAQYYLRQHHEHVRVAVLDGATPLDVPIFERIAPNSQRALDLLLARCASDAACHAEFPDTATELRSLFKRLDAGPITTNLNDPGTGEPLVVDSLMAQGAIHLALISASSAARLPMAIHVASEGRWDQIGQGPAAGSPGPANTLVMAETIMCSEAWARFDPDQVAREGAGSYALDLKLADARVQAARCRYFGGGVVPQDDAAPVRSTVPVLWVVGEADPQDPPANLTAVPSQLPSSRIVVVPGQGHTVGHLGCMPSIIAVFLDAGSAAGLDTSCLRRGGVPTVLFSLP